MRKKVGILTKHHNKQVIIKEKGEKKIITL